VFAVFNRKVRGKCIRSHGSLDDFNDLILMEKILPLSLKLNFTPNTLGCYGLGTIGLSLLMISRLIILKHLKKGSVLMENEQISNGIYIIRNTPSC